MTRHRTAAALLTALLLSACSSGTSGGTSGGPDALVVVSAPLTAQPWIGRFVERGARLAVDEHNRSGRTPHLRLEVLDDAGSPQQATANARRAVAERAVALVTDGVGARSVASVTDPARLPVLVTFEGGATVTDAKARPTVFRLAPADVYLTRRLADYLASRLPKDGPRAALLADDSSYGSEGLAGVRTDLLHDRIVISSDQSVPEGAADVAPQVLAARRSGAQVLVVWARASGVAAVVRAARSTGWQVPVYSGPAAEDPLVRQRLADHPQWLDGLTFVSFRITSEVGAAPFAAYRKSYESAYGVEQVGVKAGGRPVLQPPDWSAYSYDAVRLVVAALRQDRRAVLGALQRVSITGANGDDRGFGPDDREGVSPDDMYLAVFHDMRFAPVGDDLLSTGLPPVPQ